MPPYLPQYSAGGKTGILDGVFGSENPNQDWQGFEDENIEIILDLGNKQDISSISTNFLQRQGNLIFLPKSVTYSVSKNGKKYREVGEFSTEESDSYQGIEIKTFAEEFSESARYVKVEIENFGDAPKWLGRAEGTKVRVLLDEVVVE